MNLLEKLKSRARRLKTDTLAVWFAARDPRTPWSARVVALLVTAYAFSPIDLIPDFVPVLGYLDDLVIIPAGIVLAVKLIPPEVMDDARLRSEVQAAKPVNWWAGVLILAIWLTLVYLIGRALLPLILKKG
jgi:uncharacterized membrane protein YkvA (DUF1232 family)